MPSYLQGFFERILYFPVPTYFERCNIWRHYIENQEQQHDSHQNGTLTNINISLLAHESEYCSAGAIKKCVDQIFAPSRIERTEFSPPGHEEIITIVQEMRIDEKTIKMYEDFARKAAGYVTCTDSTQNLQKTNEKKASKA